DGEEAGERLLERTAVAGALLHQLAGADADVDLRQHGAVGAAVDELRLGGPSTRVEEGEGAAEQAVLTQAEQQPGLPGVDELAVVLRAGGLAEAAVDDVVGLAEHRRVAPASTGALDHQHAGAGEDAE